MPHILHARTRARTTTRPTSFSQNNPCKKHQLALGRGLTTTNTALHSSFTPEEESSVKVDALVWEVSKNLSRMSWLSWWAQSILTVVSAVTLLFARNVVRASSPASSSSSGLVVAGCGILVSFLSIFWTWGAGARLADRLVKRNSRLSAANRMRRAISVGVTINLCGMALSLIGAEQIVGSLAVKVLTTQGMFVSGGAALMRDSATLLQPLDILVVQGNTNVLLSHFSSLVSLLYLTKWVGKLDPPSTSEGGERTRAQK